MKITIKLDVPKFQTRLAGLADRYDRAVSAAANMAASMLRSLATRDILNAGRFGARWLSALAVGVTGTGNNMKISMTLNLPGASLFEEGGVIQGKPLLWLPLSGTDAEGIPAGEYGGLFSVQSPSGNPLLFSTIDRQPKYFGISQVTIPKLFHLRDDMMDVVSNFRALFDDAWRSGA